MGLTLPQVYRHVLLPMAFRIIIPPLTSEFLTIFKNSSTALTIGVLELTAQSRQISEYTFKTFEAFTAATLIYIVITLTVILVMRWLEKRVAVPGYIARRQAEDGAIRLGRRSRARCPYLLDGMRTRCSSSRSRSPAASSSARCSPWRGCRAEGARARAPRAS